ncbi:ABC transporter substrate-binding protein [Paenarthrobacter sp. JL.01a]|uniref:ABC transporter substrate-binding protein n=1 Tax=Paenarthrobacter sp. JL.01a TaxID=2979324 RepID=UPI0021C72B78|nr:ABC transporter substrate-binding protein [Paenarthrobacter sp. JL.01a]UXM93779.1 ABC transporter substrate-binding protein [Paenarthrobacter sp. JL.01a]
MRSLTVQLLKAGSVFAVLALTACTGAPGPAPSSSANSTAAAEPTATFNFGTGSMPLGLDPAMAADSESARVTRQVLEGLVGVDGSTGETTPLLATEWKDSNNGLTYDFTLRSKVTFHDGTPFDSAAVCANFNRWFTFPADLRKQAPGISFQSVFKAYSDEPVFSIFKDCKVVSPTDVQINLTRPFTGFLQALTLPAFAMSSPAALESQRANVLDQNRNGLAVSAYASHPVGTGPYQFGTWDENKITLQSYKGYWGNRGQIATINFIPYDHAETRQQALLDGKIDAYDLVTPATFDQLVKKGVQIIQRDPFSVMYLGINQAVAPLDKLEVRQAIEMAVDKESLIRKFFIDNTAQASQFVPPKLSGFNNNAPSLGYNPDKAKQLLEKAGYKGEELKFYYPLNATRAYMPTPEKIYAEISRQLVAVGFNIKPVPIDWENGYLQKVQSAGDRGLHLLGWNGSYADADNFLGPLFGETRAEFGYTDSEVFHKIERARAMPDGDERNAQYQAINAEIAASVPAVPIAFPISALALSNKVERYPASPVLNEVFTNVRLKS